MRVLVGCEFTGNVRRAFRGAGHDAWSNDLLPAADGSPHHLRMDVLDAVKNHGPWDIGIFHPDCTYLTIAAEWCYSDRAKEKALSRGSTALFGAERRAARDDAVDFFRRLWECDIENVCIENPVGVIPRRLGIKSTQIVQPYEYGHDASKATCLWLRGNLKPLVPTKRIEPHAGCSYCKYRTVWSGEPTCFICGAKVKKVWANQTPSGQNNLGPTPDRGKNRAATYDGIAKAMAATWG